MRTSMLALALAPAVGCTTGSPLVESSPQVELTSNPGGVAEHARFELTLTTWNQLDALADATTSGQLEARLDGAPLVLSPAKTGYFGNGDRFTATFVLPPAAAMPIHAGNAMSATVMVTDHTTTWTAQIPALLSNDLQPVGAMVASQTNMVVWPSAATSEPYSTIDFACIEVTGHGAACHRESSQDPGIDVTHEYVQLDVNAQPGDAFVLWAQRWYHPQATGDGPIFFASILDQISGTFQ